MHRSSFSRGRQTASRSTQRVALPSYMTSLPTLHHLSWLEALPTMATIVAAAMRAMIPTVRLTSRAFMRRIALNTARCTPLTQRRQPIHRRSLRRRYSGKVNSSNDVSSLSSTPVENRKSPWENLTPVVDVLAGKNSSVTSSVSCLDSDTLSASCLDTVRFPILVGMDQFRGAREIPRILDGSSWANFYPRCKSPWITPVEKSLGGQLLPCAHYYHT